MKTLILFITTLFLFQAKAQESTAWLVNMEEAQALAKELDKSIFVSFSGSDWCGNCMRLDKDLYQTEKFLSFAAENFILLNVDFPAKKANRLSAEQTAHNDGLAEKYNKNGVFPAALVLDVEGEVLGRMIYPNESTEAYLRNLKNLADK